jgi:hypothetical protein
LKNIFTEDFSFLLIGFQLLSIEQVDKNEQFTELYDFRNAPRQSRAALQPTDIGWNPNDGKNSLN